MSDAHLIRDDYSGPGGWSQGLRRLGLIDVGIERDPDACATRAANGHLAIPADLADAGAQAGLARLLGPLRLYIASPPCQTFSAAGKGTGRAQLDDLDAIIRRRTWADIDRLDSRTRHVIDTARNCLELHPEAIALEQVPSVLPLWQAIADDLRAAGYSAWCGILNAADYGVPQTRRRAILVASRLRQVDRPTPTHAKHPGTAATLFGPHPEPWVTMAEALGWPERLDSWPYTSPATTIAGDPRITARCHHEPGTQGSDARTTAQVRAGAYDGTQPITLTEAEATTLQSFPAGYTFTGRRAGARWVQLGNAIPPRLAAHVAAEALGLEVPT